MGCAEMKTDKWMSNRHNTKHKRQSTHSFLKARQLMCAQDEFRQLFPL